MPAPSAASTTVESLFRLLGSSAALGELGPGLAVGAGVAAAPGAAPSPHAGAAPTEERVWLQREGFATLNGIADRALCAALVHAIEALHERGLPASFVYAFDQVWTLGVTVRQRVSAIVGHEYRLLDDLWAWRIPPGGGRGWSPHRGIAHARLEREAPEILNVWIALSEVTADRACMHAVPLDDDPGYPEALDELEAPLASVRALPTPAGSALFWNANTLHWGGPCSARATGARVSCSFTLCRADALAAFPDLVPCPPLEDLDLAARMDILARMVLLYGDPERGDVSAIVKEWATITHALATRFGQRKAP